MVRNSSFVSHLFHDEEVAAIFSDVQLVSYMLKVEASLAMVQGELDVIPSEAAASVAAGAAALTVDFEAIRAAMQKSGIPVIELVRQLRLAVGGEAATFVHWGATSQDILDTALVLQIRDALAILEPALTEVEVRLARMADRYRYTLMAGRTHSQQALPITFGLKAAGWLAPLIRHAVRLSEIKPRLLVVQFGGAVGTLAALGSAGPAVRRELAAALDLGEPIGVWHTQRDALVEFAGWLSLVTGSLAKMAQDIILMAQSEVGEVRESADLTRGGSSTMPQKHNPMVSESILAIHRTNVGHLAVLHNALVHEHERATHSWQVEWLNLPPMISLTASALGKARWLIENLVVNEEKMQQNVAASNGIMMAEAISFALAEFMTRAEAKQLVRTAAQQALEDDRHLVDVLQDLVGFPVDWEQLREERNYLGSSDAVINSILRELQLMRHNG